MRLPLHMASRHLAVECLAAHWLLACWDEVCQRCLEPPGIRGDVLPPGDALLPWRVQPLPSQSRKDQASNASPRERIHRTDRRGPYPRRLLVRYATVESSVYDLAEEGKRQLS